MCILASVLYKGKESTLPFISSAFFLCNVYFYLPSDVSHGAECIIALCNCDSGHLVHGQHSALPL